MHSSASNQTQINTGKMAQAFPKLTTNLSDQLGFNVPAIVDIHYLRTLPTGTFGRLWADTLDQHSLQPLTEGSRRQQLHDGIHVLTGYGVDPMGEAEVQAFLAGAKFRLIHLIVGMALLRSIARQAGLPLPLLMQPEIRQKLRQAYIRGRQSNFNPDTWKPERLWTQPSEQVKCLMGVTPVERFG